MGLFDTLTDAFTGRPAKEAAAENQARLEASKKAGMGYLDAGKTGALSELGGAQSIYTGLQDKYGAGTDMYLNSLGVNGRAGNDAATSAFQAGPGYQWSVDQSLDGIARSAAARGMDVGGNTLAALGDRAGNLANQEYGGWQDRLGGLISPEVAGATGAGNALTNKAGVYTSDANSRVGLDTGVTQSINDQETQSANAQMSGSKNLWNAGLSLAQLGASGGTSLLGGGVKQLGQLVNGSPTGYGTGGFRFGLS